MKRYPFRLISSQSPIGYQYSSLQQIGELLPSEGFGQGQIQSFVNIYSGGLCVCDRQYVWRERNHQLLLYYVYNSRACSSTQAWQLSVKRLTDLPNRHGVLPPKMKLVEIDGSVTVYQKHLKPFPHYRAPNHVSGNPYITASLVSGNWIWYNPATHITEIYNQDGFLITAQDDHFNKTIYEYNGRELAAITGPSGCRYERKINHFTDGREENIYFVEDHNEKLIHQYYFDHSGLLHQSKVVMEQTKDHTYFYTISYEYQQSTALLQTVHQDDGTVIGYQYENGLLNKIQTGKQGAEYSFSRSGNTAHFETLKGGSNLDLSFNNEGKVLTLTRYAGYGDRTTTENTVYKYEYGRIKTITYPNTSTEHYSYSEEHFGLCDTHTDTLGRITHYTYQQMGVRYYLVTKRTIPVVPDVPSAITRYVYDCSYRDGKQSFEYLCVYKCFSLSPEGRVTQYMHNSNGLVVQQRGFISNQYNLQGKAENFVPSLSEMQQWVTHQDLSKTSLHWYDYDARGQRREIKSYACITQDGVGIENDEMTHEVLEYNAYGQLLNQLRRVVASEKSDYVDVHYNYDALGRKTYQQDELKNETRKDYYYDNYYRAYLIKTYHPTGREDTQLYDSQFRLIENTQQGDRSQPFALVRKTQYHYDQAGRVQIEVLPGNKNKYYLYDQQDQIVFTVSHTGIVSETRYSRQFNTTSTTQYSKNIDVTQLQNNLTPAQVERLIIPKRLPSKDRTTYLVVNNANQIVLEIDAKQHVVLTNYNPFGKQFSKTDFKDRVSEEFIANLCAGNMGELVYDPAKDRCVSTYYDRDQNFIATINAAGWVVETLLDGISAKKTRIRYATAFRHPVRPILFSEVRSKQTDNDIKTYFYPNSLGLTKLEVSPRGQVTQYHYHPSKQAREIRKFYTEVDAVWYAHKENPPPLPSVHTEDHVTQITYDGKDRELTRVSSDCIRKQKAYNSLGKLTLRLTEDTRKEQHSENDELPDYVRSEERQYNEWGEQRRYMDHFVSNEKQKILAAELPPRETENLIRDLWFQKSSSYWYNSFSGLLERVIYHDASLYGAGNVVFFYDDERRKIAEIELVYEIDLKGRVTEYRYSTFNEVANKRQHVQLMPVSRQLEGGFITDSIKSAIEQNRSQADAITSYEYDKCGRIELITDPESFQTRFEYTAFAEIALRHLPVTTTQPELEERFEYSLTGKVVRYSKRNGDSLSYWTKEYENLYDLETSYVDELQFRINIQYDLAGNLKCKTTSSGVILADNTYDLFDRISTETNALKQITQHSYTQANRTHHVIPPVTACFYEIATNVFSEMISYTDALGHTKRWYHSPVGKVAKMSNELGQIIKELVFDTRGYLYQKSYGDGFRTTYDRDDYGILKYKRMYFNSEIDRFFTRYEHDGLKRVTQVTDPNEKLFNYCYDRRSLLTTEFRPVIQYRGRDIRQTHSFAYNGVGKQTHITRSAAEQDALHVVQFVHDDLVRQVARVIDPSSTGVTDPLHLEERHELDAKGRVLVSLDSKQQKTFFFYDEFDRELYRIKPDGIVQLNRYDDCGNRIEIRKLKKHISMEGITSRITLGQIAEKVSDKYSNYDKRILFFYDSNSRMRFQIQLNYDIDQHKLVGYVFEKIYDSVSRVIQDCAYSAPLDARDIETLTTKQVEHRVGKSADEAKDRKKYYVLDAAGNRRFIIDSARYAVGHHFDSQNRIIVTIKFSKPVPSDFDLAALTLDSTQTLMNTRADTDQDQYTYTFYSFWKTKPDFTVSGTKYMIGYDHNYRGQLLKTIKFHNPINTNVDYETLRKNLRERFEGSFDEWDRVTEYYHDQAYRQTGLYQKADLDGSATDHSEHYHRDLLDNIEVHVDKSGNEWRHQYDRANRLKLKISPKTDVTTVSMDETGHLSSEQNKRTIQEHFDYDANSNSTLVVRDYQGYDAREIHFGFDSGNRLNQITLPNIEVDDPSKNPTNGTRPIKTQDIIHIRVYNTTGKELVRQKKSGLYEFSVYDSLDRCVYKVNNEGGVIRFVYNSFGEVIQVINYYTKLALDFTQYQSTGLSVDVIQNVLKYSARDRYEILIRDQRGLLYEHRTAQNPDTEAGKLFYYNPEGKYGFHYKRVIRIYDAFRRCILKRELVYPDPEKWHEIYYWYDQDNNKLASAETVQSNYGEDVQYRVKRYRYNGFKERTETHDYARPFQESISLNTSLTQLDEMAMAYESDKDIISFRFYDQVGEVRKEGKRNVVRQKMTGAGTYEDQNFSELFTVKTYTGTGKLFQWSENKESPAIYFSNSHSKSNYDACDREISRYGVFRATNALPDTGAQPYTQFGINAHGQRVKMHHFANQVHPNQTIFEESTEDRIEFVQFDQRGLARFKQDAKGTLTGFTYTPKKKVARTWSQITNWVQSKTNLTRFSTVQHLDVKRTDYDLMNRIQSQLLYRDSILKQQTDYYYSTFGESIGEGPGDDTQPVYRFYNALGSPWSLCEQDQPSCIRLYDLRQSLTAQIVATEHDLRDVTEAQLPGLLANMPADFEITRYFPDMSRRILKMEEPSLVSASEVHDHFIPLEFYVSRDFPETIGQVSLSWVRPQEANVVPEIRIGVLGHDFLSDTLEIKADGDRCGIDVSALNSDLYHLEISYYLNDPITKQPDRSKVVYHTTSIVGLLTDRHINMTHSIPYIRNDHEVRIRSSLREVFKIQLLQETSILGELPATWDESSSEYFANFTELQSGEYIVALVNNKGVVTQLAQTVKLNTSMQPDHPFSREIFCQAQLTLSGSSAELTLWETLPVDFQETPARFHCQFTDTDNNSQTIDVEVTPRASQKKGHLDFGHVVQSVESVSIYLKISLAEEIPLFISVVPFISQSNSVLMQTTTRKYTRANESVSERYKDATREGWDLLSQDDEQWLSIHSTKTGNELKQAVSSEDPVTLHFQPQRIIYVRGCRQSSDLQKIKYKDVRDDRMAIWKNLSLLGHTRYGFVIDVSGLAPGHYPFQLPAHEGSNLYQFSILQEGLIFSSDPQCCEKHRQFLQTKNSAQKRLSYYARDTRDNIIEYQDPAGHIFNYEYNDLDKITKQTEPPITIYQADGSKREGYRRILTTLYTQEGFELLTLDQNSLPKIYRVLNAVGQEIHCSKLPRGSSWNLFNEKNSEVMGWYGVEWKYTHDKSGNCTLLSIPAFDGEIRGADHYEVHRDYNELNKLMFERRGNVEYRYNYNIFHEVEAQFISGRHPTRYIYQRQNQLLRQEYPDGKVLLWSADPNYGYFGLMRTHTDLSGAVYTMDYDFKRQMTRKVSQGGNHGQSYELVVHSAYTKEHPHHSIFQDTYTLKTLTNPSQSLEWLYSSGRVVTVYDHTLRQRTNFGYDNAGRLNHVELRENNGSLLRFARSELDALGRETTIMDTALAGQLGYDVAGNRRLLSFDVYEPETGTKRNRTLWNDFDDLNRIIVDGGELIKGSIQPTHRQGKRFRYNETDFRDVEITLDSSGHEQKIGISYYAGTNRIRHIGKENAWGKSFTYDVNGQYAKIIESKWPISSKITEYTYDRTGFLSEETHFTDGPDNSKKKQYKTIYVPNAVGNIDHLTTYDYRQSEDFHYTIKYEYVYFDDPRLSQLVATTHDPYGEKTTVSRLLYDANGSVNAKTGVEHLEDSPVTTVFLTTYAGTILRQLHFVDSFEQGQRLAAYGGYPFYTANGFYLGDYKIQINSSLGWWIYLCYRYNKFGFLNSLVASAEWGQGSIPPGSFKINFEVSDPVESIRSIVDEPPMIRYTAQSEGESYQSIATALLTNPEEAMPLAIANMAMPESTVPRGLTVQLPRFVPDQYTNRTQTPSIKLFQKFVGNVMPELKWSPKKIDRCWEQVVEIIILVFSVEIALSAPFAAPLVLEMLYAALIDAGLQEIAEGLGLLSSFSIEYVIQAAVSVAVGEFLSSFRHSSTIVKVLANMAAQGASNVVMQVTEIELGFKKKIDVKQLISTMIAAGIQAGIHPIMGRVMNSHVEKLADDMIGALTNKAIMGTSIDLRQVVNEYLGSEMGQLGAANEDVASHVKDTKVSPNSHKVTKKPTPLHASNNEVPQEYQQGVMNAHGISDSDYHLMDLETYYSGMDWDRSALTRISSVETTQPQQPEITPASMLQATNSLLDAEATMADYYYAGYGLTVAMAEQEMSLSMAQHFMQAWQSYSVAPGKTGQNQLGLNTSGITSSFKHFLTIQAIELDSAANTIKDDLRSFFMHPINTLVNVDTEFGSAVMHPSKVIHDISEGYYAFQRADDVTRARAVGSLTGDSLLGAMIPGRLVAREVFAAGRSLTEFGIFSAGAEAPVNFDRGVTFFSKDYLHFFAPDTFEGSTTFGIPSKQIFLMPEEDAARIHSPVTAAIETGFAPSVENAWLQEKEIFGASFPTKGLELRLPTAEDALGNVNFRPGGNTAIRAPGTNTFLVNQTKEFVTPGGIKMPPGTVVFRLGEEGEWIPYWRFK